jgi:hypothetical protein
MLQIEHHLSLPDGHLADSPVDMQQPLKIDYIWAALCILGAVYFVFR